MLALSRLLCCTAAASAGAAPGSLSSWLSKLSRQAAQLSPRRDEAVANAEEADVGSDSVEALWREIEDAAAHATALKETDSLLAVVNQLFAKGYYPTSATSSSDTTRWATLARRLLAYSSREATSVLSYPGVPEQVMRRTGPTTWSSDTYSVPCSRETLLMTGGVVPLSARHARERGEAIAGFLTHFCHSLQHYREQKEEHQQHQQQSTEQLREELRGMNESLIHALTLNSDTIHFELLVDAFALYFAQLYSIEKGEMGSKEQGDGLLLALAERLCSEVTAKALGVRLTAVGLAYIIEETRQRSIADAKATGASLGMQSLLSSQQFFRESQHAQLLQLHLVRIVSKALCQHYERPKYPQEEEDAEDASGRRSATLAVAEELHVAPLLISFHHFVDAIFQYNATHGNALQLRESVQQELRQDLSLATLRALRVEASTPDQFLRQSMEVVDRCAPSMAVEAELLSGKVALFHFFDLNEEGKEALHADIVASLRHLVDLRPRASFGFASSSSSSGIGEDEDGGQGGDGESEGEAQATTAAASMEADSQRILQTAHEQVIQTLCDSLDAAHIDEAYGIVVAHKYHGLIVTEDVIRPLMHVMSRRGDCRVFNLVDLCVLYSNSTVDMDGIACLFRACAVAGDHYRARTLLQLLQDVVPGFLIKAPPEVRESLRELKVLPSEPLHLFVSEEEKLVRAAVAGSTGAALSSAELQELPRGSA